jgi:hypothetical protein
MYTVEYPHGVTIGVDGTIVSIERGPSALDEEGDEIEKWHDLDVDTKISIIDHLTVRNTEPDPREQYISDDGFVALSEDECLESDEEYLPSPDISSETDEEEHIVLSEVEYDTGDDSETEQIPPENTKKRKSPES